MLNEEVKKGVQWVQLHCPQTRAKSNKAVKYCKQWGVEKLRHFLAGADALAASRAFYKWLDLRQFLANRRNVRKFIEVRTSHRIYSLLNTLCVRQLRGGFVHWGDQAGLAREAEQTRSAVRICSIARGFNGRRRAARMLRDLGAKKIQGCFRMRKSRRLANALMEQKEMDGKARYLQGRYRNYRSRVFAKAVLGSKREERGARVLQARVRGRSDRRRAGGMRRARKEKVGATSVQRTYRGYRGRRRVKEIRTERERAAAASVIQRRYRGVQGQLLFAARKERVKERVKAWGVIASAWRGHRGHKARGEAIGRRKGKEKALAAKIQQAAVRNKAAKCAQRAYRTHRFLMSFMKKTKERKKRWMAEAEKRATEDFVGARGVQGVGRGFLARRRVGRVREREREREEEKAEMNRAAGGMQNKFRGFQAKKAVGRKREKKIFADAEQKRRWQAENDEGMRAEMDEQDRAARLMQGKARMYGARKKVGKVREGRRVKEEEEEMERAAKVLQGKVRVRVGVWGGERG